jgi:hypothetical protein
MITQFTWGDLVLIARLQKRSASLCPVESLTRPRWPLGAACGSLLTLGEGHATTFVLKEDRRDAPTLHGFLQVERPLDWPEMHVRSVAPWLDDDPLTWEDARTVWGRLLTHAVSVAGQRGLHRVFATALEGSEALRALVACGFSVYAREDIYFLPARTPRHGVAREGIRPQQEGDQWGLDQLYRRAVPHLVQQAEALTERKGSEAIDNALAWERGEGFVLEAEKEIVGYGHLTPGRTGHWLTLLAEPSASDQAATLVDYGLALLSYYPGLPVYCAVRGYQAGLRAPLEERGFEPLRRYCRTVKHTTVRVTEPARGLVHALEKRAEVPHPTASQIKRVPTRHTGSHTRT